MTSCTEDVREQELIRLMQLYGDSIKRMCCVYPHDPIAAEDAAQDTFIKVYDHIDRLLGAEIRNEKAWIMRIAINTCKDALRMPKDDELSQEQAVQIAVAHAKDLLENSGLIHAYASLRSERASDSGRAHYVVYCFSEPVADELPASRVTVMLDAQTGEVLSVTQ